MIRMKNQTYLVTGLVKVTMANGEILTVQPDLWGEFPGRWAAIEQYKMEHPGAYQIKAYPAAQINKIDIR